VFTVFNELTDSISEAWAPFHWVSSNNYISQQITGLIVGRSYHRRRRITALHGENSGLIRISK